MMFVAPVFIMWLMNLMFSASTTVNVKLATQDLPTGLVTKMDELDHVDVETYQDLDQAKKALADEKVDAVISYKDGEYQVDYANTDASKTTMTRQVLRTSIVNEGTDQLLSRVKQALPQLKLDEKAPEIKESYQYGDKNTGFFARMIPILIGFVVFFFVFLISGMALLKERTSGTLERLLATPVRRAEIVYGYLISYGFVAVVQTLLIVLFTINVLNVQVAGSIFLVILTTLLLALVALALGIFMSTFAQSEFQMMQFIPLVVVPQIFFSGLIDLHAMADWAQWLANLLPMKYAASALTDVILKGASFSDIAGNLLALVIFIIILTIGNIVGLKRYRKV